MQLKELQMVSNNLAKVYRLLLGSYSLQFTFASYKPRNFSSRHLLNLLADILLMHATA